MTTQNLKDLQYDATIMALRLLGEDENTFSPECFAVMRRWKPICENLLNDLGFKL